MKPLEIEIEKIIFYHIFDFFISHYSKFAGSLLNWKDKRK